MENGCEARVAIEASAATLANHYRNGFVTGDEKVDNELRELTLINNFDQPIQTEVMGDRRMHLPKEKIQLKLREYRLKNQYSEDYTNEIQYLYIDFDSNDLLQYDGFTSARELARLLYVYNAARRDADQPVFEAFSTYEAALEHANSKKRGTIVKVNMPLKNQGELSIERAYKGTVTRRDIMSEMETYAYNIAWFEPYQSGQNKSRNENRYYEWKGFEDVSQWVAITNAAISLKAVAEQYLKLNPTMKTSIFGTDQACQAQASTLADVADAFLKTLDTTTVDQRRLPYAKFINDFATIYATLGKRDDLKIELDKSTLPTMKKSIIKVTNFERAQVNEWPSQVASDLNLKLESNALANTNK